MPDICNFERLRAISMGDDEFAEELTRVFLEDASLQLERLRAAVAAADCNETAEAAHRLKGAGGNVGAEILAEACRCLEEAGRSGVENALQGGFDEVERELAKAREVFRTELGVE